MAYDEVIDNVACPACGAPFEIASQIKYGNCSGRRLKAGDEISWCDPRGRAAPLSDQDRNWGGNVLVPGAAQDSCPHCQQRLPETAVNLRDNVVVGVVFANIGHDAVQLSPPTHWFDYWSRRVAGAANEDRLQVFCSGGRWTIALADGAGGTAGGARAASQAVDAAASFGRTLHSSSEWCAFLTDLDRQLSVTQHAGQTTLVVLQVAAGFVEGASVGDSAAWIITTSEVVDLTARQRRKPLVGSGSATPTPISRCTLAGRLVVGTDGLFNYVRGEKLIELALLSPSEAAVDALIQAARLPSGTLQDDIALVVGEWRRANPTER
jgi:serine/threonine protein phosphatase PrpC